MNEIYISLLLMHILPFLLMHILNLPQHGKPIQTWTHCLENMKDDKTMV